ncbi:hypothetical protein [Mesorhizobium sp. M0130]
MMKAAIFLALLFLSACTTTEPHDFAAEQLGALGPLLKGERP